MLELEAFAINEDFLRHIIIMAMLHKWRCRRGPTATYALLTSLLTEHEDFDRCLLEELERRASESDNTS